MLTPTGWVRCSRWLSRHAERRGTLITHRDFDRRRIRACVPDDVLACERARRLASRAWWRTTWLAWSLSPPLAAGASRRLAYSQATRRAEELFSGQISPSSALEAVHEAQDGWEAGRQRLAGVDQRATFFLGAAGLTSTLLVANAKLFVGDDKLLDGAEAVVALVSLAVATALLVASGTYALMASMRTFDRVSPDTNLRVARRHARSGPAPKPSWLPWRRRVVDAAGARRELDRVGSFMLARHRTSLIIDWKLARLKRATGLFLGAGVALGVVSVAVAVEAVSSL